MQYKHSPRVVWLCLLWVTLLMVVAFACELPVVTATTIPPSATVGPTVTISAPMQPSSEPTLAPTATDLGQAVPQTSEVLIYLVAVGDNGAAGKQIGCGDSLVPVRRQIAPTRMAIAAALNELFSIKQQYFGESGLYNALYQSELRVETTEVDNNGIATVVLTGKVVLGGTCDTPRFKGQIEETVRSINGVQSVNILLNGVTIDEALSTR